MNFIESVWKLAIQLTVLSAALIGLGVAARCGWVLFQLGWGVF